MELNLGAVQITDYKDEITAQSENFLISKAMRIVKRLLPLVFLTPLIAQSKMIILENMTPTSSSKSIVLEKPLEEGETPIVSTESTSAPIKQMVPALPPQPIWLAKTGSTLRESITTWADEAGWNVLWMPEDLDYPIIADLRYEGTFEHAVTKIFRAYEESERPFWVDGNATQKALIVTEKHSTQ